MQYDVLSRYEEVIATRRKDLDLYKQMVEDYKKTNNVNIDVITIHTGEDKKFDSKKGVYLEEEKFYPDTYTFANIVRKGDKRNDEEVSKLLKSLNETDEYPKGIMVCLLNKNEKIQHVISYVVGLDEKGNKCIIHNDSLFIVLCYGDRAKPTFLLSAIGSEGMFKLAALLASNSLDIKDDINDNSKKEYFENIDKVITNKYEQCLKGFREIKMKRRLDQVDVAMCMQLSLIFCTQLLKKDELGKTEFDKLTNSKDEKPKLPLSIMKYDNFFTRLHFNDGDLIKEYNIDENNTELKEIKQAIVGGTNVLAVKEVLDWFYQHYPLNNFVDNNVAIKQEDITSQNIIKYLTDEYNYRNRGNKITRNVGWNRRRKARFNALCEILEEKINQKTGKAFAFGDDFSNFKDKTDAIEQINNLFVEDNNVNDINNSVPQQNLNTINRLKQEIANRLNQVGCCC